MLALVIGVLSALAILIVMMRLGIRKFMGYPALMDALVVLMLILMLHGTYVGMVAAVVGGLVFSGVITLIRRVWGYARLERRGVKLKWIYYDGVLLKKFPGLSRIS